MESLQYLDVESLNLNNPMNIWLRAGLDSNLVKKTTVVSWMTMGVFKTRENLAKMKLIKNNYCLACDKNQTENLSHLLLHCDFYAKIRDEYLPKLAILNQNFTVIMDNEPQLIISILNPESRQLPESARLYCEKSFQLSRSFCYDLYKKREKFYEMKS